MRLFLGIVMVVLILRPTVIAIIGGVSDRRHAQGGTQRNQSQSLFHKFSSCYETLEIGCRFFFARIAHHSNPRQNEHKPRRERVITTVELLSTLYVIKSACIFIVTACS